MRSLAIRTTFTVLACAVFASCLVGDNASSEQQANVVKPFFIVGIPEDASKEHEHTAMRIAEELSVPSVMRSNYNPVCCVWIEITNWLPNPGEQGFVIINQGGGSLIRASSIEQLRKAVNEFIRQLKAHDGNVLYGLSTNYPVGKIIER